MSLWSVPDAATCKLVTHFYKEPAHGLTKTEALHAAKFRVRDVQPHPYYWAAFVGAGEPGAVAAFRKA